MQLFFNVYLSIILCDNISWLMSGEEERRQFVVPKKEELVDAIKELDDDIENVSLNLIKCDFNAVEKDVQKAFPDFEFVKVKKYNPGSFEVIFETKIDAINFIRSSGDKKILTRRFFIKMGRQQRQRAQHWAAVGYVPKEFKKRPMPHRGPKQDAEHKEGEETNQESPKKEVSQVAQEPKAELKKEGPKIEPRKEERKPEPVKEQPKKLEPKKEEPKKELKKEQPKKQEVKKDEPKNEEPKKEEKKGGRRGSRKNQQEEKKDNKKEEPKKEEPKPAEQEDEDDGWIIVPKKKGKGK